MIRRKTRGLGIGVVMAAVLIGLSTIGAAAGASTPKVAAHTPSGTLNIDVEGGEWPSLDPAIGNVDKADQVEYNEIYGGLFQFGPSGKIIPDLATGYHWADGDTEVVITLRSGVTYTDGTPMNAQSVAANFDRYISVANTCVCVQNFSNNISSVSVGGPLSVILHMNNPYQPIILSFDGQAQDWMVSLTALAAEGQTTFDFSPVGAGPFEVVSASQNATLNLKANPHYWQKGVPKVATLTFTPILSDQSGLSALETGQTQVVTGVTTISLIKQQIVAKKIQVVSLPATLYEFISMNQKIAPFDNKNARLAIYYATDTTQLIKSLYEGVYGKTESPSGPGETWYEPTVPGYPTYNLAKAKKLVKKLGGLDVTLATTSNTPYWITEVEALQGQWAKAGITVTLSINTLGETITQLDDGTWQALDSNWGAASPAEALSYYFGSQGGASGIHDKTLDTLMNEAANIHLTTAESNAKYDQIAAIMVKNDDVVFEYWKPTFDFASKAVTGIDLNSPVTYWEYVSLK